jgi:hypothetical protein
MASYAAYANPTVMATKAGKLFSNLGNAMGAITDDRGDATQYMLEVRAEAKRNLSTLVRPVGCGITVRVSPP